MKTSSIAIIGCGNLGTSIVQGLLKDPEIDPGNLTATKRNLDGILYLDNKGVNITSDNEMAVKHADLIIVAVKPYNMEEVISGFSNALDPEHQVLISLATGITLDQLQSWTHREMPVFRAMPNIAADIRESTTCICGRSASQQQTEQVKWIFDHLGITLQVEEDLMEAATVLGACGIAYVMRFIRAMIQGGIQIGFDAKTAGAIVNQTVKGAAELLIENNAHPETEIDKVTTPKGCTIVGLNEMEHQGFSSSLIRGIVTSYEKIAD